LAEGYRKMAMLARLIANGTIQAQSYLFWDEPESNLNPRLIKLMAQVIHALCRSGVQMFIATHSLFLLRELEILQSGDQQFATRYFGLSKDPEGVQLLQGDHIDEIGAIAALEESLMQSDRYLVMGE
jgi:predicted ATPase